MGTEIERKFLVVGQSWRAGVRSTQTIQQGYLAVGPPTAVRVRVAGERATLNIKTSTTNIVRSEFEYPVPLRDAREILDRLCVGAPIEKVRHRIPIGEHVWELDVFGAANLGLVVAEIELETVDQDFERPDWLGSEVSHDPKYLNTSLCLSPYSQW